MHKVCLLCRLHGDAPGASDLLPVAAPDQLQLRALSFDSRSIIPAPGWVLTGASCAGERGHFLCEPGTVKVPWDRPLTGSELCCFEE